MIYFVDKFKNLYLIIKLLILVLFLSSCSNENSSGLDKQNPVKIVKITPEGIFIETNLESIDIFFLFLETNNSTCSSKGVGFFNHDLKNIEISKGFFKSTKKIKINFPSHKKKDLKDFFSCFRDNSTITYQMNVELAFIPSNDPQLSVKTVNPSKELYGETKFFKDSPE